MKIKNTKKIISLAAASVIVASSLSSVAAALNNDKKNGAGAISPVYSSKEVCEKRIAKFNTLMDKVETGTERRYDKLGSNLTKVKKYIDNKDLGLEGLNGRYDTLSRFSNDARNKIDTMLEHDRLNCNSLNKDKIKAAKKAYQADRKVKIEAMQTYRQAVKQLAEAVKFDLDKKKES